MCCSVYDVRVGPTGQQDFKCSGIAGTPRNECHERGSAEIIERIYFGPLGKE